MKYFLIYADYRKTDNPCKYYFAFRDDIKMSDIRQWWNNKYSWLKIQKIAEITKKEFKPIYRRIDVNENVWILDNYENI